MSSTPIYDELAATYLADLTPEPAEPAEPERPVHPVAAPLPVKPRSRPAARTRPEV